MIKRLLLMTLGIGLCSCGGRRGPAGVDEREHPVVEARPQARPDLSQRRQPEVAGYPGLHLNDRTYGGTSSWTADGDPPAGDWFAPRSRPASVRLP